MSSPSTPSLTITGAKTSWCTLRVIAVLHELGMQPGTHYVFQEIDMATSAHKSAAHMALQPFGKVPVLSDSDNGLVLFDKQSRAISRYVAAKYGSAATAALMPVVPGASLEVAARFEQAACVEASSFDGFATRLVVAKFVLPLLARRSPDKKEVATWKAQLAASLDVLDGMLAREGRAFMAGREFSLVDAWYCPLVHMLFRSGEGELITKRKHIDAWWKVVSAREAWMKAVGPFDEAWAGLQKSKKSFF